MTAPKYIDYPDIGCEFSKSCLLCPLPKCKEEKRRFSQSIRKENRFHQIDDLYIQGLTKEELSQKFSISIRTVERALKTMKQDKVETEL